MSRRRTAAFLLAALLPVSVAHAAAHEGNSGDAGGGTMSASAVLAFRIVIPERLLLPSAEAAADEAIQALMSADARRVTETIDGRTVTTVAAP
jgi:hypothetical protein